MNTQKAKAEIIKYSRKLAAYKASGTNDPQKLRALKLCLQGSIVLHDTAILTEETQPLMDRIKCQEVLPTQKLSEPTTNLKSAIPA